MRACAGLVWCPVPLLVCLIGRGVGGSYGGSPRPLLRCAGRPPGERRRASACLHQGFNGPMVGGPPASAARGVSDGLTRYIIGSFSPALALSACIHGLFGYLLDMVCSVLSGMKCVLWCTLGVYATIAAAGVIPVMTRAHKKFKNIKKKP